MQALHIDQKVKYLYIQEPVSNLGSRFCKPRSWRLRYGVPEPFWSYMETPNPFLLISILNGIRKQKTWAASCKSGRPPAGMHTTQARCPSSVAILQLVDSRFEGFIIQRRQEKVQNVLLRAVLVWGLLTGCIVRWWLRLGAALLCVSGPLLASRRFSPQPLRVFRVEKSATIFYQNIYR
jgi:hypothetical protein